MLQTMLFDIVTNYSSQYVHFYILDFSSYNLRMFGKLPHCGEVITDENEEEIMRLFAMIRNMIEERRRLFADADVSSYDAYIEVADLPLIMLVIDNVSRIEEMKSRSDFLSDLEDIMTNGVGYGIKTIYTISQINACPPRLRRNSGNKLALRVRDRFVYSDILDHRCTYEPKDTPGRGICVIDNECYEFQTALAINISSEKGRSKMIRQRLEAIARKTENNVFAQRLDSLDDEHTYEDFCRNFETGRIPLGFHLESMQKVSIPLQQLYSASLYFGNKQCVSPVLINLAYSIHREQAEFLVIKKSKSSLIDTNNAFLTTVYSCNNAKVLSCTDDETNQLLDLLTQKVEERVLYRKAYCKDNDIADWRDPEAIRQWRKYVRSQCKPVFVLFESLMDTATEISVETAGRLSAFFECCIGYNIYFIACFYSDDDEKLHRAKYPNGEDNASEDETSPEYIRCKELRHIWDGLSHTYNPDDFALLFGGQFNKQQIVLLPAEWQNVKNPCSTKNIDKLLMHYHGNTYSLSMPCEKPLDTVVDSDELEIINNGGK